MSDIPRDLPLSIVVLAKNEARNCGPCLDSVAWCNDVVLVDDYSQDDTARLAAQHGARVVPHRFESFARQRNWALEHADLRHPWVLMLDADEAMTPAAARAVAAAVAAAEADVAGFLMCRKTMLFGRWLRYSDGFPVWIMRLVRRGRARFVDAGHGEVPAPPVEGILAKIDEPFLHEPFSRGLSDWLIRHDRYSSREAELEIRQPPHGAWRQIFRGDAPARRKALRDFGRRLPCRALVRFCYQYLWKRGFLDGSAGLAFSLLMAGYEGMVVLKRREMLYHATPPQAAASK